MIRFKRFLDNFRRIKRKNILVIGNGFDLACGLKTSYADFIKYLLLTKVLINYNILQEKGRIKCLNIAELGNDIPECDKLVLHLAFGTVSDKSKYNKVLQLLNEPFLQKFLEIILSDWLPSMVIYPFDQNYENSAIFNWPNCNEFYGLSQILDNSPIYYNCCKEDIVPLKPIITPLSIINAQLKIAKRNINGWLDVEKYIEFLVLDSDDLFLKFYPDYMAPEDRDTFGSALPKNPNLSVQYFEGLKQFANVFSDYLSQVYSNQIKVLFAGTESSKQHVRKFLENLLNNYQKDLKTRSSNYIDKINFDDIDVVINYNYTSTIQDLFSKAGIKCKVVHVNGDISNHNVVFGYNNAENQATKVKSSLFEKIHQRKINNVAPINFNQLLNYSYNILIFGHSLSTADKDILKELLSNSKLDTAVVLCYDSDSLESISDNIISLVGSNKYNELYNHLHNHKKNAICFSVYSQ